MCLKKSKRELTVEQRNKRFKISCISVAAITAAVFVLLLIFDSFKVINGLSLNDAVRNVLQNHDNGLNLFLYVLFYIAFYVLLAGFVISSAWIISTKTEKKWISLLLCNSLIFIAFMNIYVSAFLHAEWQEIFNVYSTIVTTVSTVVMATAVVAFGVNIRNDGKNRGTAVDKTTENEDAN